MAAETAMGAVKAPEGGLVFHAAFNARWWWLLGFFLATAALTIGLSYRKQAQAKSEASFRFPVIEVCAASAGFAIWALSLPSTPLQDFCGYNPVGWNTFILLAGTVVIASLLHIFATTVSWAKILTE